MAAKERKKKELFSLCKKAAAMKHPAEPLY